MENKKIRVGITHGDTNGIGYELIFKTFAGGEMFDLCTPVVYGSPKVASYHNKVIGTSTTFQIVPSGADAQEGKLNLVSCFEEELKIDLGKVTPEGGRAARLALERAVEEIKLGKIDVLVTAPICKEAIVGNSFPFTGHTEFLQARLGGESLMILSNGQLRVALVTTHLPIREVAQAITPELVEKKLRLFYASLQHDFLLSLPRIAVLGLNPHNGDGGSIGTEEKEIIIPVIEKLREEGLNVFGPYAADGFFGAGQWTKFDGVLAMYHDQGLVPLKTISMADGINFTAGLNFVRTSPDHGTAFEIAGKGVADETSFRQAIYAAIDIYRKRRQDDAAKAHPLPKLYHDKQEDERPRRFPKEIPAKDNNASKDE